MSAVLTERVRDRRVMCRTANHSTILERVETLGKHCIRYGLVLVLLWIGGMKFSAYEAEAISGLVANSPLMRWAYSLFSVRAFSAVLGITEISIVILIAARPVSIGASASPMHRASQSYSPSGNRCASFRCATAGGDAAATIAARERGVAGLCLRANAWQVRDEKSRMRR